MSTKPNRPPFMEADRGTECDGYRILILPVLGPLRQWCGGLPRTRMPRGPAIRYLELLGGLEHSIHQSRLLKRACEGELMTTLLLCDLESSRRFAIFVGPSGGAPSGLIRRWMAVDRAGSRKHSGLRLQ